MPRSASPVTAYVACTIAGVIFGGCVVATKRIAGVPASVVTVLRFLPGALFLMLLARKRPTRRDALTSLVLGAMFFALYPVLLQIALRRTVASHAALIIGTQPAQMVVMARLWYGQKISSVQALGLAVGFSGIALLLHDAGPGGDLTGDVLTGDAIMVLAAMIGAGYFVFTRPLAQRYGGIASTGMAMFASASVVPFAAPDLHLLGGMTAVELGMLAFLSVMGTLAYAMWNWATARLPPGAVGVFLNLVPVSATTMSAFLLGERVSLRLGIAMITIVASILFATRTPRPA